MFVQDNLGEHIVGAISRTICKKHGAPEGIPCWHLPKSNGFGYYPAICGGRIRLAGFAGKISPQSMRAKSPVAATRTRFSRSLTKSFNK